MVSLKIDLKKAYDRVEWSFLKECLQSHNLNPTALNLLMDCVFSFFVCSHKREEIKRF